MATHKDALVAFTEGFLGIDAARLADMPDVDLAKWQSGYPADSAHYVLAEREWQRRMIQHQLTIQYKLEEEVAKVNRWWGMGAAIIGVVGTLAGAALGAWWQAQSPAPASATTQAPLMSAATVQVMQQRPSQATPSSTGASQAALAPKLAASR